MSGNKDDLFKNKSIKEKIATIIWFSLLIAFILAFVFGIFFFGFAGIFKILGVHYDSIWSLLIFVVVYFVIGIFIDLFFVALAKIAIGYISGSVKIFISRILFDFASNWLVLSVVDFLMDSITLTFTAKLIIASFLALLDVVFDGENE